MTYRTNGPELLHNGQRIHLNGINWTGAEQTGNLVPYGPWGSKSYPMRAKQLRSLGINAVRVPLTHAVMLNAEVDKANIGWEWIDDHRHLEGKGALEVLDYFLKSLEAEGIRYVLDHHYLEPGSGFPGDIPPLWYTGKFSESEWLRDLETLAKRYKGWPGFIGIDLKNEPNSKECSWGDGNVFTDWRLAVNKAWRVISAQNDSIIVWVSILSAEGGVSQIADNLPDIPSDRMSITAHEYGPDVWKDFGKGFDDKTFPANMPKIWHDRFAGIASKVNVNIGEWGGWNGETIGGSGFGGMKDRRWQEAFADFLELYKLDHFYWLLDYTSHDTGGLFQDAGFDKYFESKAIYFKQLANEFTTFLDHSPTESPVPDSQPVPKPDPVVIEPSAPVNEIEKAKKEKEKKEKEKKEKEKKEKEKKTEAIAQLTFVVGELLEHRSGSGPTILYLGDGVGEYFTASGDLCRLDVDHERFVKSSYQP